MNRRFSGGLHLQTNYTWAKSLDEASDDTNGAGTTLLLPRDSNNARLDRGRSAFDIRHQFRAAAIYELPFGKGKPFLQRGVFSRIVGGWTATTILDRSSGIPGSIISGYEHSAPA